MIMINYQKTCQNFWDDILDVTVFIPTLSENSDPSVLPPLLEKLLIARSTNSYPVMIIKKFIV